MLGTARLPFTFGDPKGEEISPHAQGYQCFSINFDLNN